MRKMIMLLTLLAGFAFTAAPLAAAQDDAALDVAGISESVMSADVATLLTELETPPADEDLPEGFSNAVYSDPDTATGNEGVLPTQDLAGAEGSVPYVVDYDPAASAAAAGGTPAPEATPSGLVIGMSSLQYVFFDEEIDEDALNDFKDGVSEGMATDDTGEATIEDITIGDTDAVLITYTIDQDGILAVVQMVALPVGNSMVISMVTVASDQEIDADAAAEDSVNLTVAGAEHLGVAAEAAQ